MDVKLRFFSKSVSSLRGWMQSTGQTSTQAESLCRCMARQLRRPFAISFSRTPTGGVSNEWRRSAKLFPTTPSAGTNKQHVDCTRREGVSQRLRRAGGWLVFRKVRKPRSRSSQKAFRKKRPESVNRIRLMNILSTVVIDPTRRIHAIPARGTTPRTMESSSSTIDKAPPRVRIAATGFVATP